MEKLKIKILQGINKCLGTNEIYVNRRHCCYA